MTTKTTIIGLLRIAMGWIFLWAFLDKTFGLGFATPTERAWINGGSPTAGYLSNAPTGPFAETFNAMAGVPFVDYLFMAGLLGVGVALVLGVLVRIASVSGVAMLLMMYFAVLLPENNPIIDDHIIYALVMMLFIATDAGKYLGVGEWWQRKSVVQKFSWLR
jgi:thiosulfate dehydrogenase [quinone] large subunit